MSQAVRCQEESGIDEPTRERQQERATKDKRCPHTHWHLFLFWLVEGAVLLVSLHLLEDTAINIDPKTFLVAPRGFNHLHGMLIPLLVVPRGFNRLLIIHPCIALITPTSTVTEPHRVLLELHRCHTMHSRESWPHPTIVHNHTPAQQRLVRASLHSPEHRRLHLAEAHVASAPGRVHCM